MKNYTLFLLILSAFIYSCENEETPKSENPSIVASGELTGKIEDFESGDIDSIQVYDHSDSVIGSCNVDPSGEFSIRLTIPNSNPALLIDSYVLNVFSGNVSNLSASFSYAYLLCYKGGNKIGRLGKCNYPVSQTSNNVGLRFDGYNKNAIFGKKGSAYSDIVYFSDSVTIKGNGFNDSYNQIVPGIYVEKMIVGYDLFFKKGWNEVVVKYTDYSTSTSAYTFKVTVSNMITNDLKWRFFRQ